jgi:hypothetical protein
MDQMPEVDLRLFDNRIAASPASSMVLLTGCTASQDAGPAAASTPNKQISPTPQRPPELTTETDWEPSPTHSSLKGIHRPSFRPHAPARYRFAPRIRNIGDTHLYTPTNDPGLPALAPLISGTITTTTIAQHWDEILRLAASIKTGTVTASLMMRKLAAYPRQNGLALALRELGRMKRVLLD